jgi:hypothetical protein
VDERYKELERTVPLAGLLGYLNFSDGRPDPRWQKQLNDACEFLAGHGFAEPWRALHDWLTSGLRTLQATGTAAFRDVRQAEAVLSLFPRVLTAYRRHHADLFAHLADRDLFQPFFLARVFEAILALGPLSADEPGPIEAVLTRLNDFVGYRPIAILETRPQGEPYDHERIRPVPLYLRGAGVAGGRYHDVIVRALEILTATDPQILAEAQLDPQVLDELALDVRAYDHGHPVNRRPNYVFGEWDPHQIDNQGRYRRYVIRQVTLDALLDRVENPGALDKGELLPEAAAVLAGTILMAAGVSGSGPAAHDSSATLATLLPPIARYRDAFYEQLLRGLDGAHGERLRAERETTRQPFGAARQHLNAFLARHRAAQMQQRYLALLFAEMGYPDASREEARRIPAVSLRMLSEILGRLTSGAVEVEHGRLREAARLLPEVEDLLRRGIGCGAFADPWNVLGFQGLFPLSPAREDSVRDPRIDELVQVVEQMFNLYARLMSEAAAAGDGGLVGQLTADLQRLASWWDRFATYEVGDVHRVHGGEASSSAGHVAEALARWHERGEATADLGFWRGHLDSFRSPKAFALVVDALLRKGDYRASMALLMNWLGQVEQVPLEDGPYSFHGLALRWMLALTENRSLASGSKDLPARSASDGPASLSLRDRKELVRKFIDYLEANAEDYWQVPALELVIPEEGEADEEDLYGAAYDDVTYQDSTGDDTEGEVADGGGPVEEFDLEREGDRLEKRLRFLSTVARLWQVASRFLAPGTEKEAQGDEDRPAATSEFDPSALLSGWLMVARGNQQRLLALLDAVNAHPVPEPGGDYDSLVEFDRRRVLKEQLLHAAIGTCLDTYLAAGALHGALYRIGIVSEGPEEQPDEPHSSPPWEPAVIRLEQALFRGDPDAARTTLAAFLEHFQAEPLLVTPLAEGGTPRQILRVRIAQTILRALLANLPRLGLLRETFDLLKSARAMEQTQPPRGRGVTEYNHFFQAAYQAVVESVVESAATWDAERSGDAALVELLERLTAPFLRLWIEHSRTLHLSVLETINGETEWQALQQFVQRYGGDLFHARFMTLANLRGVLHRGPGPFLDYLRDNPDPLHPVRLIDDLGRSVRREDAVRRLEIVLLAVVENYEEYKDYNTTTTQSDYGENLHVLLDFLRLKAGYDRHAWQFRPLILAHEVLARRGRAQTAVLWEESLTQFTRDLARQHLEQLARLERARGVRLGTIADRLNERFVKPLALDRLCALIEPAMREARGQGERPSFARLREELRAYTATPTGVGLDVPFWLRRLELEVHRVQAMHTTFAVLAENFFRIPRRPLTFEELQRQLREWDRPALPR